ncbi:MAG: division/cell wall cluster transcriptional repressor MraZ [Saprospiraceae bacterium]|nr:division/cell wall cluster transcriptional repressor MraZ [Saprospiraceae bacterium]
MENRQLLGEYECKLDPKGRLRLPSGLIARLGEAKQQRFVINRGFEKCLMLYPEAIWQSISLEVNQLNIYNKKNRDFVRYFYRGAQELEMDGADRILIPKRLLEYAGIDKDIILSAYNGRIEIWSQEEYDRLLAEEPSDFSDLAEDVLGKLDTPPHLPL